MAPRTASGKFSLSNFGRKVSDTQYSPSRTQYDEDGSTTSPTTGTGNTGLGKKIGHKIAHQTLLPALGNKDLRVLQE